jgi:hypothetical protein
MMVTLKTADNAELREAVYAGKVVRIPANAVSRRLVKAVWAALEAEFGTVTARRQLQFKLPGDEFYARIGKVRKRLACEELYRKRLFQLLSHHGFTQGEHAVDPVRLRAVTHLGHENPKAAPAYTAHRDSWYANPQAQINWWIPLHAVTEADSFAFYHDLFDKPVPNNSADFDYDEWMANIGWQSTSGKPAVYPSAQEGSFDPAKGVAFCCGAGDIILFSAAHLHQTMKNASGLTRFSIDFRTVHLGDHSSGKGAANVDNQSTGDALKDYVIPTR